MATPIDFKFAGDIAIDPTTHTVSTADTLEAGIWTVVPHLYARVLNVQILTNGYQTAELVYRYGRKMVQPGQAAKADYPPLDIEGKYVRIEIAQDAAKGLVPIFWYGYILTKDDQRGKVEEADAGPPIVYGIVSGIQRFKCVSLDYFFDRRQMDTAVHYAAGEPGSIKRIKRRMTFNGGTTAVLDPGYVLRGNRHEQAGVNIKVFDDPYVTAGTPGVTSEEWTASEIAQHIFEYHSPRDINDVKRPCEYELTTRAGSILSQYKPAINPENSTPLAVLRRLFDPKRGVIGWVTYDVNNNKCQFDADTLAVANVSLPSGTTLPANSAPHSWDFDQSTFYGQAQIGRPLRRRYNRIRTRGAKRQAVFSISIEAATAILNWTTANRDLYRDGASGDASATPAYGTLAAKQKADRNDAYRRTDLLKNVFEAFAIPANWDGRSNDGTSAGAMNFACPNNEGTAGEALRLSSFRLLNKLPLLEGYDYSTSPSNPTKVGNQDRSSYLRPFAIVPTGDAKFQYCDKLNDANYETGTNDEKKLASYRLEMESQIPGLRMISSAGLAHTLAGQEFVIGTNAEPSKLSGEVFYGDVIWTVCGEWDAHAEAVYPAIPATSHVLEELVIDLGDKYRYDYLAPNTIVHLTNGKKVIAAAGGAVRDDRTKLGDFARLAFEWYEDPRVEMTVPVEAIRNAIQLGWLITEIGANGVTQTVNTPVTSIEYDLSKSKMKVRTATAELDVKGFGEI